MFEAATVAAVALGLLALPFHIKMLSPLFLLVFWLALSTFLVTSRLVLRYFLQHIRLAGRNLRNLLVVGTNCRAMRFAKMIESRSELGYRIVGFVDKSWTGIEAFSGTGHKVACDLDHMPNFLRSSVVDEVIIALPLGSMHESAAAIVRACEEQGITTGILSDIFDLKLAHVRAENIEDA
jgi:FlaA1/EpsC-like NDP-sugar epimerase